jgi:hypothetical protein
MNFAALTRTLNNTRFKKHILYCRAFAARWCSTPNVSRSLTRTLSCATVNYIFGLLY